MAQDDRKGQPSTRGRSPPPPAPGTPDKHDINAAPLPEQPVAQPTDAGPPAAVTGEADDGNEGSEAKGVAPATPAGAGAPGGGEDPPAETTSDLEEAVKAAKKALKDQEDKLARHKEEVAAEQAAADLVKAYKAEENALRLAEHELKQYQAAETDFLARFLLPETKIKIEKAAEAAKAEIDSQAAKVSSAEETAAAKRTARDDAKEMAVKARTEADALKRPAGSIWDRLKAAEAIRSEAEKASDDGKYALAYWLVMPGGKLDQAIKAEPPIFDSDKLREQVTTARKAQEEADQALADREKELKEAEDLLRDEQVLLVDLKRKFDATVLKNVAALNPTIVKAA
jgi:hypothetical protein